MLGLLRTQGSEGVHEEVKREGKRLKWIWSCWQRKTSINITNYRPQRSYVKVMFSQACVKNSVHKGGVADTNQTSRHPSPPDQADTPPPDQAETPPDQADKPSRPTGETATAADSTHPTGMHSCYIIWIQWTPCGIGEKFSYIYWRKKCIDLFFFVDTKILWIIPVLLTIMSGEFIS